MKSTSVIRPLTPEEWLEQNTAQCPMGRMTRAQCERNRARPTIAGHGRGEFKCKAGEMALYMPIKCEQCRDPEKYFKQVSDVRCRVSEIGGRKTDIGRQKAEIAQVAVPVPEPTPVTAPLPAPADTAQAAGAVCEIAQVVVSEIPEPISVPCPPPSSICNQLSAHRIPRPAWNKKPHVPVECPCGKVFEIPVWKKGLKLYCSVECRRKFKQSSNRKYPDFTPEMDAEIRRVYENEVAMLPPSSGHAPVRELAKRLGLPRWKVSKRAFRLGLVPVSHARKKEPDWCEAELALLKENASLSYERIRVKLLAAGYKRGLEAIRIKLVRTIGAKPKEGYSANSLAGLFGVDSSSIRTWIDDGLLSASRQGTSRTEKQGGDSYLILPPDVRRFIIGNVSLVDFRKVDKHWLVEMLTEGGERKADSGQTSAAGASVVPKPEIRYPKPVLECRSCGKKRPHQGRGLCPTCYYHARKAEAQNG